MSKKENKMADESSFQGIIQFTTPRGDKYRAMDGDAGMWKIFRYDGDGAYIYETAVRVRGRATPDSIYAQLCDA